MAFSDILDSEAGSSVRTKLNTLKAVEAAATADQTDAEIETAYNTQVIIVSQSEAEAGTSTTARRWTAQRVSQAIAALAAGGLSNVVDDTTPQLGGNLDVAGQSIISVSDGNIPITPNGTGAVIIDGLSWPQADGAASQFLQTDGAGQLSFATVTTDVVGDTTPQLGGNLDVNGNSIVSVSDGNIPIAPNGTGSVIIDGLSWPQADGAASQFLQTDGAGNLSFATVATELINDTSPQLGGMLDVNGQAIGDGTLELLTFVEVGSAINHLQITNAAIGNGPELAAVGDDTNVPLNFASQAAAAITFSTNSVEAINIGSTQEVTFNPGASVVGLTVSLDATPGDAIDVKDSGATTVFKVEGDGSVLLPNGSISNVALGWADGTNTGFRNNVGNYIYVANGSDRASYSGSVVLRNNGLLGFSSGTSVTTGEDTVVDRNSAGNVGLGSGGGSKVAGVIAGNSGIALGNATEGGTARLTRKTVQETHTLSLATTSDTTTISIPSGARLLAVSFNVNTAVTNGGDNTWSAAFITGSTTPLVTAAAAAQDTKVNKMLPDEISTGIVEIQFTPQAGSFTAGVIEIVAYYEELTSLASV